MRFRNAYLLHRCNLLFSSRLLDLPSLLYDLRCRIGSMFGGAGPNLVRSIPIERGWFVGSFTISFSDWVDGGQVQVG